MRLRAWGRRVGGDVDSLVMTELPRQTRRPLLSFVCHKRACPSGLSVRTVALRPQAVVATGLGARESEWELEKSRNVGIKRTERDYASHQS